MALILVIDDEKPIREVLKALLERSGYDVETAGDGNEGLRIFNDKPIDLTITDIIMPGKEGLETIKDLKKIDPDAKIIALSGGSSYVDPKLCLNMAKWLGAEYVFSKPVRNKELLNAVREMLL